MIDWTQPIELDDGTPLIAAKSPGVHTIDIYLAEGQRHGHPAFPALGRRGWARLDTGLVGSNHKYKVRNRMTKQGLNLTFQTGDKVRAKGGGSHPIIGSETWVVITRTPEGTLKLHSYRSPTNIAEHIPEKDMEFACHHAGAPFEKTVKDEAGQETDGYVSGLYWGLANQCYQAGGPGVLGAEHNSCRHLREAHEFDKANATAWLKGWAEGQAEAKKKRPKLKLDRPLRTVGTHKPVEFVGMTDVGVAEVTLDGKSEFIHTHTGLSKITISPQFIVENVVPQQTRSGYMIVGAGHVSIEETLEAISKHWWNHQGAFPVGAYIVRVEQQRETDHEKWKTVKVEGPLEPLPKVVRRERRMEFDKNGSHIYGPGPKRIMTSPDNQFIDIVFESGKIVEVKHG